VHVSPDETTYTRRECTLHLLFERRSLAGAYTLVKVLYEVSKIYIVVVWK
jgi:hypothetical protein